MVGLIKAAEEDLVSCVQQQHKCYLIQKKPKKFIKRKLKFG